MKPSFLMKLEKQQVDCHCFDTSPKNGRRIFRSDSLTLQLKQKNQLIVPHHNRNESEESKHKKKSLKKKRQPSTLSESDSKPQFQQVQDLAPIHQISDPIHTRTQKVITDSSIIAKEREKQFDFFDFEKIQSAKGIMMSGTGRQKQQSSRLRNHRGHQQIANLKDFRCQSNLGLIKNPPSLNYELNLSREFQKDLLEYKKTYQKQKALKEQKREDDEFLRKQMTYSEVPLKLSIKKLSDKSPAKSMSYRGSRVNDPKQSPNRKVNKNRILPKQIESEGGTDSQDNESEVIGRGWNDSDAYRQEEFDDQIQESNNHLENDKIHRINTNKTQTMATRQSNIKHSETKTTLLGEYSSVFTTTKSHDKDKVKPVFPFGEKKYAEFGHSYKHITDLNGKKVNHAKINN